jgi:hypothetical protein
MYAPGMGIYEKTTKKRIAGVHIRIRILQSQTLAPRVFRLETGDTRLPVCAFVFNMAYLLEG